MKGLASNLYKQGSAVASLSVGEIIIQPENVTASEKLQELDLLQYALCNQIRDLPKRDSLTTKIRLSYIVTLQKMLFISQNPSKVDSIVNL